MPNEFIPECAACGEEINYGAIVFIVCARCAQVYLGYEDPKQLTLFELPQPKEVV